jgi:hypothetical protein
MMPVISGTSVHMIGTSRDVQCLCLKVLTRLLLLSPVLLSASQLSPTFDVVIMALYSLCGGG